MSLIDTKILSASSEFAGFAVTDIETDGTITIPAGQNIPDSDFYTTTFKVKLPDDKSFGQVQFQLLGPTQSDGGTHNPDRWKFGGGSSAKWFQVDGLNMDIYIDILSITDVLTLQVQYFNYTGAPLVYGSVITVNAKVFYYRYPWGP